MLSISPAFANLPALTLEPQAAQSSHAGTVRITTVAGMSVPVLDVTLRCDTLARVLPHLPLHLHPVRTAYLTPLCRSSLHLPRDGELLIEASMPEALGARPLADWCLRDEEIERLAAANAASNALFVCVHSSHTEGVPRWHTLMPFRLDWAGWSGFAHHLATGESPAQGQLLHMLAHLLEVPAAPISIGRYYARAYLHFLTGDIVRAAEACRAEIQRARWGGWMPSISALPALALLGTLQRRLGAPEAAYAALALALRLNHNHADALMELCELMDEESVVVDILARLSALPMPPVGYPALVERTARRLGLPPLELAGAAERKRGAGDTLHLLAARPAWLPSDTHRWLALALR